MEPSQDYGLGRVVLRIIARTQGESSHMETHTSVLPLRQVMIESKEKMIIKNKAQSEKYDGIKLALRTSCKILKLRSRK